MITKVRINQDDNKVYHLIEFNANMFNATYKLSLMTDDISSVKTIFSDLETVEIFINNNLIAEYSIFDGFSTISYLGMIWCEGEGVFSDCLEVTLTKIDMISEIERIKNIVEPIVDLDSMTLEELKEYKNSEISKAGSSDIYAGDYVTLESGETKIFSYSVNDQNNLEQYLSLIAIAPDREALYIAYHGEGEQCQQYGYRDIVTIYFTLSLKKLRVYTYVNMLREYVNTLNTRDAVLNVSYGDDLPLEYETRMSEIMTASIATIMQLKEEFIPSDPEEETPVDDNTPVDTEGTDVNEGTEE